MDKRLNEENFEAIIEEHFLNAHGYAQGDDKQFDRTRALFCEDVIAFIKQSQPKQWAQLEKQLTSKARPTLLQDLIDALDSPHRGGCLGVLRNGFKCYGISFRMAHFKPASGLNPDTQKRYEQNILSVTRQLHYSDQHNNSLDMVIAVNGIPIITMELKNRFTGQNWRDAVWQYKTNRSRADTIFHFNKRSLVNFALDSDQVYMTTKLNGEETQFLPFNKGDKNKAGNPDNPNGFKTAYLWEEILAKDSILEIVAQFIHLEKKGKNEKIIFPRYHQLDAVRKMVTHAREHGTGNNYLIQHSAGSGKSNSIAWLSHRLASLHDQKDKKIFHSVIVITDRLVLDKQLQETIGQFEQTRGVVHKIDQSSKQLADAITAGAPIIVTTLQKFPFAAEKMQAIGTKNYAVIIDEAHSSQSGERASQVKELLSPEDEINDVVQKAAKKRGRQKNISFFAFTATPKYKTIEIFGQLKPNDKEPKPFHLYSMRQAIKEGFILDVLKNYTNYKMYCELLKSVENDPRVKRKKAARALARFISLHPTNIAQKIEVIIEHFRAHTMNKIGGKAKAMIVTAGRAHAIRYKCAFEKYIKEKGYKGIKALVAFSAFTDENKVQHAEEDYNKDANEKPIGEKELPQRFAGDEFQVLIVAEKYQTGFDQPLLHTMYVDKKLEGIQAVQTLSRLNRITEGKEDTFVLDFFNQASDIDAAFQVYYQETNIGERVETRKLYDLHSKLKNQKVYFEQEIDEFSSIFYKPKEKQTRSDQKKISQCLDPAARRFSELDENKKEDFRKSLFTFRNLYGFMAQIIPFQDTDLEKHYSFIRHLLTKLPKSPRDPIYNFDDEVALKNYRLQKIREGSIKLSEDEQGSVDGPTEVGTAANKDDEAHLSKLIEELNKRFGTNFGEDDSLFFKEVGEKVVTNENVRKKAKANSKENFGLAFDQPLKEAFLNRMKDNERITEKFMNDENFREVVRNYMLPYVYNRICGEDSENLKS